MGASPTGNRPQLPPRGGLRPINYLPLPRARSLQRQQPSDKKWRGSASIARAKPLFQLKFLTIQTAPIVFALLLFALAAGSQVIFAQARRGNSDESGTANSTAAVSGTHAQTIRAKASWYGPGLNGHKTITGTRLNPHKLTAASSTIPLGSTVRVKNLRNGRSVKVTINDCGQSLRGYDIDLSSRAAQQLRMKHQGIVPVELTVLKQPDRVAPCSHQ